ncbi:hypothetical protein PG985_005042 [Apiospora marii]|uniref:Uncharacterized protein n=1 Tax=Apiospora marii TaxID=335849 RepID=A0ABR1SD00_9PEZI
MITALQAHRQSLVARQLGWGRKRNPVLFSPARPSVGSIRGSQDIPELNAPQDFVHTLRKARDNSNLALSGLLHVERGRSGTLAMLLSTTTALCYGSTNGDGQKT